MEQLVCICGAGTMGRGIALVTARNGFRTVLYDADEKVLGKARGYIGISLDNEVARKKISAEAAKGVLDNIQFSSRIGACIAPMILEAIYEDAEAKASLFEKLDRINSPDTLFATNTSSLSIRSIARRTSFPERIAGLHFFNPAERMKLVEIVSTDYSSPEMLEKIKSFAGRLGKTAVLCKDHPGFIVNRVARPFYLEALRMAEKKMAGFPAIDRLMESAGFKMGPFHLMDLIGNDINYAVSQSVYEALGKPGRLKPSAIQQSLVQNGMLGRKTGAGYFTYSNQEGT